MNKSKDNLPQNVKPRGFWGRIAVRVMAKGLKTTYTHVATVLDLHPEDDLLEIGFGSGIFMRSYAAHVRSITGLDHSEDMVKLATKIYISRDFLPEATAIAVKYGITVYDSLFITLAKRLT